MKNGFTIRRFWAFNEGEGDGSGGSAGDEGLGAVIGEGDSGDHGLSAALDIGTETSTTETDFAKTIPDEYREKPWVKNLLKTEKPGVELFKQMDGLQKKLGERQTFGVPDENATDEERANFYKALGVPDKADEYELTDPEWSDDEKEIGEAVKNNRNENVVNDMKDAFLDLKVPKNVAAELMKRYEKSVAKNSLEAWKAGQEAEAAQDKDFDERMLKRYGDKTDTVLASGKKVLDSVVPADLKGDLKSLDAKSLNILAVAVENVRVKYIKEDGFDSSGVGAAASSESDIRAEGRKMMSSEAYRNVLHKDHDRVVKEVREHYKQLNTLRK